MTSSIGLQGALTTGTNLSGSVSFGIYRKGYVWIKWCATEPTENSQLLDIPADYIGIYSTDQSVASDNYADYNWYKYKGEIGASAYQSWINAGNTGTEADFLHSLQGEGLEQVDTYEELPSIGNTNLMYFVKNNNCLYSYTSNGYVIIQPNALTELLNILQLTGDGSKVLTNAGTYITLPQTDNNYTNVDKDKLSGIAAGAQVNTIERIVFNGTEVPINNKAAIITEDYQVRQYASFDNFPNMGNPKWLYLDKEKGVTWRWDDAALLYYITGADYTKIDVINGGIANG